MKTYTEHEINGLSIYVDYAYNTRSRVWDNVSGDYTLAGLKRTKRLIEWH